MPHELAPSTERERRNRAPRAARQRRRLPACHAERPSRRKDAVIWRSRAQKNAASVARSGVFRIQTSKEENSLSLAGLAATYSPRAYAIVPLALKSLTAEFGMGSG